MKAGRMGEIPNFPNYLKRSLLQKGSDIVAYTSILDFKTKDANFLSL